MNQNDKLDIIEKLAKSYIATEMDMVLDDQQGEANEEAWDTIQKTVTDVAEEL